MKKKYFAIALALVMFCSVLVYGSLDVQAVPPVEDFGTKISTRGGSSTEVAANKVWGYAANGLVYPSVLVNCLILACDSASGDYAVAETRLLIGDDIENDNSFITITLTFRESAVGTTMTAKTGPSGKAIVESHTLYGYAKNLDGSYNTECSKAQSTHHFEEPAYGTWDAKIRDFF